MITLAEQATQALSQHAEATYPEECVGLLLGWLEKGQQTIVTTFPVENRWFNQEQLDPSDGAATQRNRFYLDPRDFLRASRAARAAGLDVVGCYHSHPDQQAIPSERDRLGAQLLGGGSAFVFAIQRVDAGCAAELRFWLLAEGGTTFREACESKEA